MKSVHHGLLLYAENLAICHCRRGAHPQQLTSQRSFAKKVSLVYDRDGCFLADLGYNCEPHFAFLHIEDSVGVVALRKDCLLLRDRQNLPALADGGEKSARVESAVLLDCCGRRHRSVIIVSG